MFEKLIYLLWLYWEYSLIGIFAFLLIASNRYKSKHRFNIWVADKHLKKLKKLGNSAKMFGFCRNVNPYIFEEMVLTAFKNSGYKVRRSKSYSGDGGKDGEVFINGEWAFIQSKRYKRHIKKAHVTEFRELCEKKRVKGIFVHCGRTSKNTWKELGNTVQIVSGNRLLYLLVNNSF